MRKSGFIAIICQVLILLIGCQPSNRIQVAKEHSSEHPHKIAIIGTGYVGLVAGACLSEFGHKVICCDVDQDKIAFLEKGGVPIFELGLKELIDENKQKKRLFFDSNIPEAIQSSDIILVCVGTPTKENGESDVSAINAAAKMIGENLNASKVILIKSTVPVGKVRQLGQEIQKNSTGNVEFHLAYVPEFLREGTSVQDFLEPERVVVGTDSTKAQQAVREMLSPLYAKHVPFIFTSIESAEVVKYGANSFLAVKVSFINEIANLCDATGANVEDVSKGLGLDSRIGPKFLNPGPGYGGSCLPKDTQALLHEAEKLGVDLRVIKAATEANDAQMQKIIHKLTGLLHSSVQGKTIAVLGLAFKQNTDDVRSSPSLRIIDELLNCGARIKAYDPKAMPNAKKICSKAQYCNSIYDAVDGADAVMVLTEWKEFQNMDLAKVRTLMRKPVLVDARNLIDPIALKECGFVYENVGHPQSKILYEIEKLKYGKP